MFLADKKILSTLRVLDTSCVFYFRQIKVSDTLPSLGYMLRFLFWIYLQIPTIFRVLGTLLGLRYTFESQVYIALYCAILEDICNPPGPRYNLRYYVHFPISSTYCAFILDIYKDIYNLLGLKYILRSQIHLRVSNTHCVFYFGQIKRFLQSFEFQVHNALYALGRFESTYNPPSKYTSRSQIHVIFHILDKLKDICYLMVEIRVEIDI